MEEDDEALSDKAVRPGSHSCHLPHLSQPSEELKITSCPLLARSLGYSPAITLGRPTFRAPQTHKDCSSTLHLFEELNLSLLSHLLVSTSGSSICLLSK